MSEVEALKEDMAELKNEVRDSLAGIHSDLKSLSEAFRDLVRLDGDINRVATTVDRIGKEVDELFAMLRSETKALDERLRKVENNVASNNKSVDLYDDWARYAGFVIIGLIIGGAVVKVTGA